MNERDEYLVSVIVPNYNHAKFLHQRIDSILKQTYQNFELILLDDCSTDDSQSILHHYKSLSPKVASLIINEQNSGSPFKQWEKGVKLSKGELIWIAESDDFADERFLEKCVRAFLSTKNLGIVYTQSFIVDENSQVLSNNVKWTDDLDIDRWRRPFVIEGKAEAVSYLLRKNTIPNASAVLIAKECFDCIILWPKHMIMVGDWMIWIQLLKKTNLAYIPECLNYFRETNQSTRNHFSFGKKQKRIFEELQVVTLNALIYKSSMKKYIEAYRSIFIRLLLIYRKRLFRSHNFLQ